MIRLFHNSGKLLFFPKKWANSIVRWIAGINSPSGTINVKNTLNPGDGGSLELDVNMKAVVAEVLKRFEARNITKAERARFVHLLRGMVDGCSVLFASGHLSVSADWMENAVRDIVSSIGGGGSGTSDALTSSDIGTRVQAYSALLTTFATMLRSSDSRLPITELRGQSGNSDYRLVRLKTDGTFDYATVNMYKALLLLEGDYDATGNVLPYAEWAANATKASSLVGTDTSGNLKRAVAIPTTTQTYDRVLRVAADGTALSWTNQSNVGKATDPSTNVVALTPTTTTSSANTTTWTTNSTNGVTLRVHTRTRWSGTTLYGFYRDITFDKFGRLYSITAETRYTIDTPTTVTWS